MLRNTDKGGKGMKKGAVVTGVVLIILGVLLYFSGNNMVEEAPFNLLSSGGFSAYENAKNMGNGMVSFGVILGIIGVVAVAYGFTSKNEKDKGVNSRINERFCTKCGRVIPFDARICPYCKKDFEAELIHDKDKTEEKEEIQEDNSYICSKCGYENIKEAKFCGECGNKL